MSQARVFDTYSVFVGHLPSGTQKHELRELFQECGNVVDTVVLRNGHSPYPCYGFVRYSQPSAVYKAVAELNSWTLNGTKLVVEISMDTCEKIKQEKTGQAVTVVDGVNQRNQPIRRRISAERRTTDVMYHSRLLESCASLSFKNNTDMCYSTSNILDDVGKMKAEKCSVLWSSVENISTNFDDISSRIMQRCRTKSDNNETLGKKKAAEFLSSLRSIMREINALFEPNTDDKLKDDGNIPDTNTEHSPLQVLGMNSDCGLKSDIRTTPDKLTSGMKKTYCELPLHMEKDKSLHCYISDSDTDSDEDRFTDYEPSDKTVTLSGVDNIKRQAERSKSDDVLSWFSSSDDNELSIVDPAVIDYHLSKLKDIELSKNKNVMCNETLENLFKKCSTQSTTFHRSESLESNDSSCSNDAHIVDSGVEADFGRSRKPVVLSESLNHCKVFGRGYCPSTSGMPAQRTVSECKSFNLEEYVLKNKGRGRGFLGIN